MKDWHKAEMPPGGGMLYHIMCINLAIAYIIFMNPLRDWPRPCSQLGLLTTSFFPAHSALHMYDTRTRTHTACMKYKKAMIDTAFSP